MRHLKHTVVVPLHDPPHAGPFVPSSQPAPRNASAVGPRCGVLHIGDSLVDDAEGVDCPRCKELGR